MLLSTVNNKFVAVNGKSKKKHGNQSTAYSLKRKSVPMYVIPKIRTFPFVRRKCFFFIWLITGSQNFFLICKKSFQKCITQLDLGKYHVSHSCNMP